MLHDHSFVVQGVANRDIKLENTLLDGTARPLIKICDFGYSKVILHTTMQQLFCLTCTCLMSHPPMSNNSHLSGWLHITKFKLMAALILQRLRHRSDLVCEVSSMYL